MLSLFAFLPIAVMLSSYFNVNVHDLINLSLRFLGEVSVLGMCVTVMQELYFILMMTLDYFGSH